jgi:hypothetical protein
MVSKLFYEISKAVEDTLLVVRVTETYRYKQVKQSTMPHSSYQTNRSRLRRNIGMPNLGHVLHFGSNGYCLGITISISKTPTFVGAYPTVLELCLLNDANFLQSPERL